MPDREHSLRILHISDLHERGPRETERARRYRVLGDKTWSENLSRLLEDGPIDLVCFTGDAADWGKAEEYAQAAPFFRALLQRLNLPKERLFVVPGNHDIDRSVEPAAWAALRTALARASDHPAVSRWLQTGEPPPGIDAAWRDAVLARQRAWRQWVERDLDRPDLLPERSAHRALGYRATLTLPHLSAPVHVIGLDTAWLCGDDHDATKLRLTDDQILKLATQPDGPPLPGLRVVLMHHPFGELADGAQSLRLLADHADIVLRGHLHDPELSLWADPDRRLPHFAAGCLFEKDLADHYRNSHQVLTLDLSPDGRVTRGQARFRSWSARGHWFDDDGLYRGSRSGRLDWAMESRAVPAAPANPYDPWTPATGERCVGRDGLFRDLADALERKGSVAIIGYRRSGKTSVLETWAAKARDMARTVRYLSGERAEGVSIGSFATAITEWPAPDGADAAADVLSQWAHSLRPAGLPPLILVDEADGLFARFDVRFFERVRGMLERIVWVFATHLEIDLIYQRLGLTSPFENRLALRPLGLLEPAGADAIIRWGGWPIDAPEATLMREWAGRHPFFLQLLGYHLVSGRRNGTSTDDVLDGFRYEAGVRLREIIKGLSDGDWDSLRRALDGRGKPRLGLRQKGLVTSDSAPFGRVLTEWMADPDP